ncbi:anthranilate synthase component I family protein [Agromyces archimandritae]|uniref:Anthranilate synthase component I family protein n=2 Tax=Agromyces archimandritae TaxID=2781962 RepID=A0A975IPW9_9MICO|nr:anthranilate synthase component I family protein [Agromyces archimandritae]
MAAADAGSILLTADAAAGTITRSRPLDPARRPETSPGSIFDVPEFGAAGGVEASPLGWIGWFGYEAGARHMGVPFRPSGVPDAAFLRVDRALVFDHATGAVEAHWRDEPGEEGREAGEAWARRTLAEAMRAASAPAPEAARPASARIHDDEAGYAEMIDACLARIAAGDAYQLCLTTRIEVPGAFDPVAVHRRLRRTSPSHHGGLLRFGGTALVSASPERFLAVDGGRRIRTTPMKGTRPRSADPGEDARLAAELLASEKERAENIMIVDLMRNDLGRIAALGTVHVPELHLVESYPQVHQLVSTVAARLGNGIGLGEAIAACFPAGSMTGAPKRSAMTILHGLESSPRGPYAGAFGVLGFDGTADLAMGIRSIVLTPAGATIGTGGGITALSVAAEEIEETRVKARALLAALGAAPA